jgi:hypothetical protein
MQVSLLSKPSKRPTSSSRRFHLAAEVNPKKLRPLSCSSPPMKVLTSPVWISLSMEGWRRSDLVAVPWLAVQLRQSSDHLSQTSLLTLFCWV